MRVDETRQQSFARQINLRCIVCGRCNATRIVDKEALSCDETAVPIQQ